MRYFEIISESTKSLEIFGISEPVKCHINPTPRQFASLLEKYKELRGIEYSENFYIWNAYEAAHFQIESYFGFPRKECAEFMVAHFPDSAPEIWASERTTSKIKDRLKELMIYCSKAD